MLLSWSSNARNTYYRLRATPNHELKESAKHIVLSFLIRTFCKKTIQKYMKYIVELSGVNLDSSQDSATQGQGANFFNIISTLDKKLTTTYPKPTDKVLDKYLYRTIKERFKSQNNASIEGALEPFLTATELMVLHASSEPVAGLRVLVKQGEANNNLKKIVVGTLTRPLAYSAMLVVAAHFLQPSMVDKIIKIITKFGGKPEGSLAILNSVNLFMINMWLYALILSLIVVVAYRYFMLNLSGKPRATAEFIPVVGVPFRLSRMIDAGLFLQSLALLYSSGVNTKVALKIIQRNSSPFLSAQIEEMLNVHARTGSDIQAFDNSLFNRESRHELSIYFELTDPTTNMNRISTNIISMIEKKVAAVAIRTNVLFLVGTAGYLLLVVLTGQSVTDYLPTR